MNTRRRSHFFAFIRRAVRQFFVYMTATAVIFSFPGITLLSPLAVRAATAVAVTNGTINGSFQGTFVPATSPAIAIMKISVTADAVDQTLTSVTVNFSGTGFVAGDLAAIATGATSGVALYNDAGGTANSFDGTDAVVTLAASPDWTPSTTNITLTPATPVALANGSATVFYVVIKTSGTVENNDEIRATVPASGVVTSGGNGPAVNFEMNFLRADTAAPAIAAVEGFSGTNTLTVRFNKPVRKVGGGNIAFADSPFTFVDNGTTGGTTITGVMHTEGQNFATVTLSDTLDGDDFVNTPSTLAAGNNKIADFGGSAVGTNAVNATTPLTIITPTIPTATVGTVYNNAAPLVSFAGQGGTGALQFDAPTLGDTTTLTNAGLAIVNDGGTYKLTGTVANIPGSYPLTIRVGDAMAVLATKQFTLNIASSGGGVPGITNVSPAGGPQGASNMAVTITGSNTLFSGSSTVQFLSSGTNDTNLTVSSLTAGSTTSLSFNLSIAGGATVGNRDVKVTTGSQIVTMPNGFSVFATGGSGLNLLMPSENATNVQLPPGYSFSPSVNASVNSYRVIVKSNMAFSGSALWDYTFPKPSDGQNSNGSHCTATSCNLMYGQGTFRIISQPTPLSPNTTYYWQIKTYAETVANVSDLATALEQTPVRGFTTVSSISDVTPPMVMHRPVMQLKTGADRILMARVNDNMATPTSTPALTTSLKYCNSSTSCDPAVGSSVDGVYVAAGYWKYTLPQAVVDHANSASNGIRYFISATDGTNTYNFKQPDNTTPFTIGIAALATTHKLVGVITDQASACLADAYVFADGTAFNNLASATTCAGGTYSLGSIPPGSYDLVALKEGYAERRLQGVFAIPTADSTPAYSFSLMQGGGGGFGGDTTNPRVKFTGPMDGMTNMPGGDTNFKIMVAFTKTMSQSTITATNLTVNEVSSAGTLTDITSTKGTWTYYSTAPNIPMLPPEANMAVWSFSASNTFGDNKNIAVKISSNVTDTSGNAIQGNQSDGSYVFTFTTGSSANFSGFNNETGTFSGGGTFGSGQFVPPHVMGTTPPPGSAGVPTNTKVVVNFSEAMADDGGSYLLKDYVKLFTVSGTSETDVSTSAISSVALDTTKRNATVTLSGSYNSGAFAASTNYRIKILGGAKSGTGITLSPPNMVANSMFQADFKTGTGADSNPPTVVGSYPDNAATNVPVNVGAISVGFNKDISASTITTTTFYLSVGSTSVNGTVQYDAVGRQAMFMPQSALSPSTTYTLNLTTGIQGINGVAIAATTKSFTTGSADTVAPSVSFINADDYNLAITFSEPMNAAKATDTANFAASVIKPANYTIKYATPPADSSSGTVITLPATANFAYDASTNTVSISGYHDSGVTGLTGKEIYVSLANVKDLSGNVISGATTGKAPIANSATTKGALGPGAFSGDAFSQQGGFVPMNFSSSTFGFAPSVEVRPFNAMVGQTTIYGVRLPVSSQIPASGTVVLTFPTGFDVSGAKQDVNSPMRTDLNGSGAGTVTFKCATAGAPTGAACAGTANADDTGAAQGGLAGDGVVVNTSSRTVTIYLSAATRSESGDTHDFLTIDIAGIKNSTVPKDFNTTGYSVDVKTKNGSTVLESATSMPFFIQGVSGESYTLTGTITAAAANSGTVNVYLMSPMTGPMDATSSTFAGGSATYTFANLPAGEYMLFTDPSVTLGATEYAGKPNPERVVVNETADTANAGANDNSIPYNFTIANASASGTAVTVRIDGPSNELLDIFASSANGFKSKQVTLDASAGAENFTIYLTDGDWSLGVGPQMPKGFTGGPPSTPSYMPPKPENVRVEGATITETSGTANDGIIAVTLTSTSKTIRGVVKDGSNKVMANAEVYAYSPQGGFGTHVQSDSTGSFSLGVADGTYIVGSFVPGMPSSREVPVAITSDATTYLLIDGATTAITPAAAATTFVIKVAKPDYTISGKVTDGTSVVQGASVYAYRTDGPGHAESNTDSSGNYTLYVSNGTWNVGAFLPQYGQLTEVAVTVNGDSVANQNFAPSGTGTFYSVSGTVTSGGSNVQGAFVRLTGNGKFNEAITGADGTYSFNVPEGNNYVLKAFLPGIGEALPLDAFNVSGANVTGKNFVIAAPRTITITVSTAVTEAYIDLFGTTGVSNHVQINNGTSATLQLPNGSYKVDVHIPGVIIGPTDIAGTDVNTVYSNTTGIVVVNGAEGLTVTVPTLRTISGTVKDSNNTVIADAWVEIGNAATGVHFGTKSATDGTFSLKVANATTDYFINAMKPGYFREPSTIAVTAAVANNALTGLTLTLATASTTISGQVLIGAVGASNAFVRAERQGGGSSGTQADTNGNYTLPVNGGVWKVFAVAEGYAEVGYTNNPIDVTGGSVSGKNITLSTTVSLRAPKSKPITPASGGTLEDTTAGVKLTIPANALGSSTSAGNIQVKETNNVRATSSALPVGNKAKEIKATNSSGNPINTLNDSVNVEMNYTVAELEATRSASDASINTKEEADQLKMAYWDETTANWVPQASTITYKDSSGSAIADLTTIDTVSEFDANVASVTIAAATDHFSLYAPVVSTDPAAPSAPTGLAKTSATTTTIIMGWTAVGGSTSYDIYRSATSGGTFSRLGSEPTVSSGSTVTYTDSALSAGTTYYYKITALNASGESAASSEVSIATAAAAVSSPAGGSGGGYGYISNSSNTPQTNTPTPATETQPTSEITTNSESNVSSDVDTARQGQMQSIITEASSINTVDTEGVASAVGKVRDTGLETRYDASIVAKIIVTETSAVTRAKVLSFVTYGTATTLKLGAGERGGVVNSYREAFGKVPESATEWEDVLKIANGRWPSKTSTVREQTVAKTFKKVYLREANRTNAHDDAAITVMAYGLRSVTRNVQAEQSAIKTFKAIYKRLPSSATHWDTVRAIAYSGATR
ncbi:MAG: carboxypeptidase regulatory-like domain-containing protein [Patescibacteria group bacterium]|jgi:hypothetical protein